MLLVTPSRDTQTPIVLPTAQDTTFDRLVKCFEAIFPTLLLFLTKLKNDGAVTLFRKLCNKNLPFMESDN